MATGKRGDGPNKMQLVRDAMDALGPKAKPTEIQKEIKEKHNLDMNTQMISTYKSMIKKPAKGKAKATGRPAKAPAAAGGEKMNIADDVILLRTLVSRLGARQLHQLIDVLS